MALDGKPLGPNALADEKEHRAFMEKCGRDLTVNEPPKRQPSPAPQYVTQRELGPLLEKIGRAVAAELKPLRQRIAELEQGQVHMAGTYKAGQRYRQNGLVSFQGGLWLCLADTDTRPGSGSPAWRLAVKRGDAK